MKKLFIVLSVVMLLTGCSAEKRTEKTEVTLFHATDMHYLSQQLTDNSEYFVEMIKAGDGKLTHYSEQISDAFVETVIEQKPDAVLIGGDISFNCEKLSHEDFIKKLQRIEKAGVDVLVIPGNHDVEYPFSRGYEGNTSYKTDYTTEADFVEYYKEFGPDIAYTVSPDGLSYIAQLGKDIYVAAVYTPQSFLTGVATAEEETLLWLEQELAKLPQEAKIISLTHQNIVDQYPDKDFCLEYTVYNSDRLTEIFEKYGVDANLSGHIHVQHIEYTDGGIPDIATASMSLLNCQYGVVIANEEKITYYSTGIKVADWAEKNGITDENLLNFSQYSKQFYIESAYAKAYSGLEELKISEEEKEKMAMMWAEFNTHYFMGTANEFYPQMLESEGYKIWQEKQPDSRSFTYMLKAFDENTLNNRQNFWYKSLEE